MLGKLGCDCGGIRTSKVQCMYAGNLVVMDAMCAL
jgi:hypothetical protein